MMIQEEETSPKTTKPAYVYLLECSDHTTYVGATTDLEHRLRQHNKEIKGGAVATSKKVSSGEIWRRVCYVQGFPDWKAALQFEWRFKQLSRKLPSRLFPLTRRFHALQQLLDLEKPTSKSIPYSEWKETPQIVWTEEKDEIVFSSIQTK